MAGPIKARIIIVDLLDQQARRFGTRAAFVHFETAAMVHLLRASRRERPSVSYSTEDLSLDCKDDEKAGVCGYEP